MKTIFLSFGVLLCSYTSLGQSQPSKYNKWDLFFKEFKAAIIKDDESKLLLLSNKTLADMPAKDWIRSAKGGSEFSSLRNGINNTLVQSEGGNKKTIDFAETNNCYLEFRLTNNGWKFFNVVYYAD
jgi:hypothetical protein